jgi:ethanolamine transporter EutH
MKRTVWTFGLIAGAIMAVMMAITVPLQDRIGDAGEIVGYTTMVLAFLMVYFGVRSYRDSMLSGVISFGRAFRVGISIALVASTCYVATWEVIYHTMTPDFADKYAARAVEKARASGASQAQIEAQQREMAKFKEQYKNPLINVGYTYLEVLPVGIVVCLVSAGILSRRKAAPELAAARV